MDNTEQRVTPICRRGMHCYTVCVYIPYFLEKTLRLLFISALLQCGDYSRAATIRSTDVAATIYFSSTAMRRLFEGGYYSKYRRRGYYLFQLYCNAATIRGRLLFEVQTSQLLFISALPQCGDYSRAATIRSTDAAATIYFSSTAMLRLFEGGYYSKFRRRGYYLFQLYRKAALILGRRLISLRVLTCNLVPSTFTRQFPADAMTDHGEFVFVCSFMCTSLLGSP